MDSLILRNTTSPLKTLKLSLLGTAIFLFLATTDTAAAQAALQTIRSSHVPAAVSAARPLRRLDQSTPMQLSIVLPPRNQNNLKSLLSGLYDPSSPDYHHFLSVAQFADQFSPTAEDYQAVIEFARANGFTVAETPSNRMVVTISGSAAQVEKAFNVRMNSYQHPTEKRAFFSPDREPSLALKVPVAHIAGLNNYSIPKPLVSKPLSAQEQAISEVSGSGPGGSYLASDMRAVYYTSTLPAGGTELTGSGQTVGLVQFDGYNINDVVMAFNGTAQASANGSNYILTYTPTAGGQTYRIPINNVLLDGTSGAPVSGDDAEEVLDTVQAIGMAPGLSQVRVYIGNSDVDILNSIASENLAQQVSISWGWCPDDPVIDDVFFQEMAAQGQSVFAASGDYGAFDPIQDEFYPAEDAWVTAVGGTDLNINSAGGAWLSETAWDQSAGGISPDGIPIPSWQKGVANSSNGGSTTLRNVPDVAAEGNYDNYDCNMGICQGGWAGTSFASPRWAGFMALVNQQAAAAGDLSIGFLNPAIYAIGASSSYDTSFHDITSGNNACCGQGTQYGPVPTYNAVAGYDLVTGWGSPTGHNLIDSLAPLKSTGFKLSASLSSLTIAPGASGTTTINITGEDGFTGSVKLDVSGLPNGVTASFGTNPATGGSSTLILTVSNSAMRGSYLLSITGASGAETATTTLALAVNAPGFTLSPSPGPMYLYPGTSTTTTIMVADYAGFTGSVNLAVTSGLPSGVIASWTTNPTAGSSVLTLTASSSIPNADTILTITGTSGALSETATVPLWLQAWNFRINASPIPVKIVQGKSVTSTLSLVPLGNVTGSITLSAPSLPAGVTASFSPSSTSGSSVLTLTASSSAPLGTSDVEIGGTISGSHLPANEEPTYEVFPLTVVSALTPTFTVGVSPASLALTPGASGTATVTTQFVDGFNSKINLWLNGAPAGISATFTPNPATGSSLMTMTASSSTLPGIYWLSIVGTAGSQSQYGTIWVTVNPLPSFTLSASPTSLTLAQGASATDIITVTPQSGFTGNVTLSALNLPSGLTASFTPNSNTGTSSLTLNANSSIASGNYTVIVTGTSGAQTITAAFALTVNEVEKIVSSSGNFGAVSVGTKSPSIPLVFTFDTAGVIGSTAVLTQGAAGLDFADAGTGSCTANTSYSAGQTCTVNVTFTPKFSGTSYGAVELLDNFGKVLATSYLQGTGVGPQINFLPGVQSAVGSGYTSPRGLAVDGSGNVFVADTNNNAVKEILAVNGSIPASPTIKTIGSGIYQPFGVAIDGSGNIYVTDATVSAVYEVLKAGGYTTVIALGGGFNQPTSVAVDGGGNVYVTDYGNNAVKMIPPGCIESTCVTTLGSGLSEPWGVVLDSNANVYVTEVWNSDVKEILAAGGYTTVNTVVSGLSYPQGLALDGNSNLYVVNAGSSKVMKFLAASGYATMSSLVGSFDQPLGVTVDQAGNVYVADSNNNRVVKLDYADPPSQSFATTAAGSTSTDSPRAVTVQNVGNAALNFSAVSYPASFPESSHQTTDCVATTSLSVNASCTLTINFSPLTAGTISGSLSLTDNALNGAHATQKISLNGKATLPQSFKLGASPASVTVIRGASGRSTIAVTGQNGFTGSVTLAASGLPSGVTAAFATNPTTGSSVLTLTASSSATVGIATITITGTSGSLSSSTTISLTVPSPSFKLSSAAATLSAPIGGSAATSKISVVAANGFTGTVAFTASGLPTGVTASFSPTSSTSASTVSLTAGATATPGSHSVTITGTSGLLTASGSLTASTAITITVPTPSSRLSRKD